MDYRMWLRSNRPPALASRAGGFAAGAIKKKKKKKKDAFYVDLAQVPMLHVNFKKCPCRHVKFNPTVHMP